jgi:hypothetical protein
MKPSVEVYADIVLSINGEDVALTAHQNELTIRPSSIVSGLHVLSILNDNRNLFTLTKSVNKYLEQLGWTIYTKVGIFKLAILGLKGKNITFKLLIFFGDLVRSVKGTQLK